MSSGAYGTASETVRLFGELYGSLSLVRKLLLTSHIGTQSPTTSLRRQVHTLQQITIVFSTKLTLSLL